MPVQNHPRNPRLRGNMIQARRGETAPGERFGCRGKHLLAPLRTGQAPYRLGLVLDHP
jgi:hypothetical protein